MTVLEGTWHQQWHSKHAMKRFVPPSPSSCWRTPATTAQCRAAAALNSLKATATTTTLALLCVCVERGKRCLCCVEPRKFFARGVRTGCRGPLLLRIFVGFNETNSPLISPRCSLGIQMRASSSLSPPSQHAHGSALFNPSHNRSKHNIARPLLAASLRATLPDIPPPLSFATPARLPLPQLSYGITS